MTDAERLDTSPFEADLYLMTFGGRFPKGHPLEFTSDGRRKRGIIEYRKLDDKREWESFLELDLVPAIQRVCARYGLEVSIPEGAPPAAPPAVPPAAPPAPPPAPDDPEAKLRSEMEDRLAQLGDILDEEKKAASLKRLEKAMEGLDEDLVEGVDAVRDAIEEYRGVEKAGMTPQEYQDEKTSTFEAIGEAVSELSLVEEDEDEEEGNEEPGASPPRKPPRFYR